jgi:hypothetical protein
MSRIKDWLIGRQEFATEAEEEPACNSPTRTEDEQPDDPAVAFRFIPSGAALEQNAAPF